MSAAGPSVQSPETGSTLHPRAAVPTPLACSTDDAPLPSSKKKKTDDALSLPTNKARIVSVGSPSSVHRIVLFSLSEVVLFSCNFYALRKFSPKAATRPTSWAST